MQYNKGLGRGELTGSGRETNTTSFGLNRDSEEPGGSGLTAENPSLEKASKLKKKKKQNAMISHR